MMKEFHTGKEINDTLESSSNLNNFFTLFITVSVIFIWQSLDKHGGIIPGGMLISPGGNGNEIHTCSRECLLYYSIIHERS